MDLRERGLRWHLGYPGRRTARLGGGGCLVLSHSVTHFGRDGGCGEAVISIGRAIGVHHCPTLSKGVTRRRVTGCRRSQLPMVLIRGDFCEQIGASRRTLRYSMISANVSLSTQISRFSGREVDLRERGPWRHLGYPGRRTARLGRGGCPILSRIRGCDIGLCSEGLGVGEALVAGPGAA